MSDVIVLVWVGFIFFGAVFFTSISILHLVQQNKIGFDKGFLFSLSACLLSVLLCLSIWPPVHRVYQDEFTYISQSVNILYFGKASITTIGSLHQPEAFFSWTANPKLPGFAWLEAVILFLTKDFEHSYFLLNIVLGALSVVVVYRIAWALSASHAVAWWSAVFLACLPARITYSMSDASDTAGLFFFLLYYFFIIEFKTIPSKRILYAALFCGIYSICIKPFYAVLMLGGTGMALRMYQREGLLDKKLFQRILLDIVCLFLPILSAAPVFIWSDSKAGAYSFSFMLNNFYVSASYLFQCKQNTLLTSLLVFYEVGRNMFYKKDNLMTWLAGWFFMGLLMFSVFFSGGISYPGHAYSDRYFLFLAFPFVFLAAKGMVDILTGVWRPILGGLFFIILVVNAVSASNHLNYEARYNFHYQKTLLLKQIYQLVPNEAYILDECAALVTTIGPKKAINTDIFLDGNYPQKLVYLKGIPEDLYNSDDPKRMILVNNVLNAFYRCKPLTDLPIKEAYLSATPFLCTRK